VARAAASREKEFHEAPLVGFTALATMGCGVGAAHLLAVLIGAASLGLQRPTAILLTGVLAAALLLSLGHLGRPYRSPLALRGVGRSPLSHEVVALGAALGGGLAVAVLPPSSSLAGWASGWTSLASLAVLLSIGLVYRLTHQYAWRGAAQVQPLVQGTLWGWVGLEVGVGSPMDPSAEAAVHAATWILLAADAALFISRMVSARTAPRGAEPVHPGLYRRGRQVLWMRVVMGIALPAALLLLDAVGGVLLSLTLGVVLDRLAFYGLARRWTTEAEVASVEALL
jgi:DMSO reductase anchor subunit